MIDKQIKKRHRTTSINSSTMAIIEGPPTVITQRRRNCTAVDHLRFNDPTTSDVILLLRLENSSSDPPEISTYLHSSLLNRTKYFSALLSDRWNPPHPDRTIQRLSITVSSSTGSIGTYLEVLRLLYASDLLYEIRTVPYALDILPVALEFLFEDCVSTCLRFLEAVPWTQDEERRILNIVPLLRDDESREILDRVSPADEDSYEEMLHGLILSSIHNHPNVAVVKAFVGKLLREFSSRRSAGRVLSRAFETSLRVVKESVEKYSRPDFRGDNNETEAIQRLNLHTAMTNGRNLLWVVERMIELRVADFAVKEWSEQAAFTADLQRAFRDDAWKNIVPSLPVVLLRSTCKLANAVATGTVLAPRQVRMKLVNDWLPVLNVCRDKMSSLLPNHKPLYLELEETFLKIISTLPMSDAQALLQQCLSFATRDVEDCPHLVTAFNTWFCRATKPPLS